MVLVIPEKTRIDTPEGGPDTLKTMTTLWVKRTDSSSYFPSHFHEMESRAIGSIAGIQYVGVGEAAPATGDICLLTNTHTRLDQWKDLRARTKFILHPNSGFENLMPPWEGVPVVLGNDIRAQAVVEWTLACLFQHFSPIKSHSVWPKTRTWDRGLLRDQKILILGAGLVGQRLLEVLTALGCKPAVHDPHLKKNQSLTQAWSVVLIAASVNPASRGLLNESFFATLASDAVIINGARAEIMAAHALESFLQKNSAARAYLDVHEKEPFAPGDHPQIIRTPHIAGVWHNLLEEMIRFEVRVLTAWSADPQNGLKGFSLMNDRLTPQGWYR
jgi:D-3-phosphoglycerate dehydrogenase